MVCLACTARNDDEQVAYSLPPRLTMPPERRANDVTPLVIGQNTIPPDRRAPDRAAAEKSIGG